MRALSIKPIMIRPIIRLWNMITGVGGLGWPIHLDVSRRMLVGRDNVSLFDPFIICASDNCFVSSDDMI